MDLSPWTVEEEDELLRALGDMNSSTGAGGGAGGDGDWDWEEVARRVGSKNHMQCLMKFLSMPLEDFGASDAAVVDSKIPFSSEANPLMAQLAFLVNNIHPQVSSLFLLSQVYSPLPMSPLS